MEALYDEAYRLFSKLVLGDHLREGTSTSLRSQLANIYTMDDKNETLRYSRLSGILTLDIDRKLKTTLFRMYSVHSLELIFECELYYGFEEYHPCYLATTDKSHRRCGLSISWRGSSRSSLRRQRRQTTWLSA